MDAQLKARGREASALRIGLSQAREDLLKVGDVKAAKAAANSLRRADRLGDRETTEG